MIDDRQQPVGIKGGVHVMGVALHELMPETLVFQKVSEEARRPFRVGPTGPRPRGRFVNHVLAGPGRGKTLIHVEVDPAPSPIGPAIGPPELDVVAGPVALGQVDVPDLVVDVLVDVHLALDDPIGLGIGQVSGGGVVHHRAVAGIAARGDDAIAFQEVYLIRLDAKIVGAVVFIDLLPEVVNAPILAVQEEQCGPIGLNVDVHVLYQYGL